MTLSSAVNFHVFDSLLFMLLLSLATLPVIIGFAWVRPDANRLGQPGWLWALLTLPGSWVTLLVYVAVRLFASGSRAGAHP